MAVGEQDIPLSKTIVNREALSRELDLRGWTLLDLQGRSGVSEATMAKIDRGEPVRRDVKARIAEALAASPPKKGGVPL